MRISHGRSGRPLRLALRALEVPVGLQERLLGEVLGVVVVADPVVRVRVDVAQVRPVELGEVARRARALSAWPSAIASEPTPPTRPSAGASGAASARSSDCASSARARRALDHAGQAVERPARRRRRCCTRVGEQRHACRRASAVWPSAGADLAGGHARGRAARRRGGCGCRSASTVATRSPAPARPANVSRRRAARGARARRPRRTPCRRRRRRRSGRRGAAAAAASAAAFLAQPASSTPVDVGASSSTSKPGGGERVGDLAARSAASCAASDERGAVARARRRRGAGPPRHADRPRAARARRRRRSAACRAAARGPWTATSTPARGAIARAVRGDARRAARAAGTAKHDEVVARRARARRRA